MDKSLLNKIFAAVFKNCEALSNNVQICFEEQTHLIRCEDFENPVFDIGDINLQSIYASERIAHLIDSFGLVSNFELRYKMVLAGIYTDKIPLLLNNSASLFSNEATAYPLCKVNNVTLSNNYLKLSDLIREERENANIK